MESRIVLRLGAVGLLGLVLFGAALALRVPDVPESIRVFPAVVPADPLYWATILFNIALPQLMWFRRLRLNQTLIMLVCFGVIVGMWCERYTIVVMSLRRTHLPSTWGDFHAASSPPESFCACAFCQ
jgi:hypothetical protein